MSPISYDQAVPYYDSTRGYPSGVAEQIRDAIIQYTQANSSTQFLEFAIGTGLIAIPFLEAGYNYVGVDISPLMIQEIFKKLETDVSLQLVQTDITQTLPFPDNSFDVINAVRIFHLLDDWKLALAEARRILHPNGYLIIGSETRRIELVEFDPPSIVHRKLDEILETLGIASDKGVWRLSDETIVAHLQDIDAKTDIIDFVTYESQIFSVRSIVERHKQRIYSRYWELPDDIHAKAMIKLDFWLNNKYADPDKDVTIPLSFRPIIAKWGTS